MMFGFVLFAYIIYSFQEHLAVERSDRRQLENCNLEANLIDGNMS